MPETVLIRTLAAVPAFQAMVGAADAAEAALRIHRDALDPPDNHRSHHTREELETIRPCALVWLESYRQRHIGSGDGFDTWDDAGTLKLQLLRTVPDEQWADDRPTATAVREWMDTIKAIIAGLCALAAVDDYLAIEEIFFNPGDVGCAPPERVETEGMYQAAELTVTFGARH